MKTVGSKTIDPGILSHFNIRELLLINILYVKDTIITYIIMLLGITQRFNIL